MRKHGRKNCRVYVSFMDLEKAYDMVNRGALWQVLRIYGVGGKLLDGIKSMYVNSLACVRVKGSERECFRINSGVRQGCIMSPWFFNIDMGTKTFADVGDFLTTSVSTGLSKDMGSIHLILAIQEQHNNTPYRLELNLSPSPADVARSFPPE